MVDQLHRDATLRVITHGHVMLASWRDAPTIEQMLIMGRISRTFVRTHDHNTALWNAILSGKPTFSEAVRREVNTQSADPALQGLGTAHVVLLDGFTGAATRAFLSAANLASRPKTPTKVFGDIASASTWLVPLIATLPGAPNVTELQRLHRVLVDDAT